MDIHLAYINDLLERQTVILEDEQLTCKDKLQKVISILISDIEKQGPSGRVFFREMRHLDEKSVEIIREKRETFRFNIESIIKEGIVRGEFRRDLQANMIAFAILGMTNWSYQWFHPTGEISTEELTRIYVEMILKGIGQ